MPNFKYPKNYDDDFINTFKEVLDHLNEMGYTYEESLRKAQDILDEAKQTNDMNKAVDERLDNIIASSGTSSTEVVDARIGADGTEYSVLKERLDKRERETGEKIGDDVRFKNYDESALITFITDDGVASDYTHMMPIFDNLGVPFTTAVVTNNVRRLEGYLTKEQMDELHMKGHEICSHTHSFRFDNGDI